MDIGRPRLRNMQSPLIDYFDTFLGRYFLRYPKREVKELGRHFTSVEDTFMADLAVRYPAYNDAWPDERALVELLQFDPCLEAVLLYRLERSIFLENPDHPILPFLSSLMRLKTGIELYYSTEIGPGLNVMHGVGVVVGPRYRIGSNFRIYQGVTIGQGKDDEPESITIGDNVRIFAGAKVIGDLHIGDNVHIGANALLINDAESNSVYLGIPARKVRDLHHDVALVCANAFTA